MYSVASSERQDNNYFSSWLVYGAGMESQNLVPQESFNC